MTMVTMAARLWTSSRSARLQMSCRPGTGGVVVSVRVEGAKQSEVASLGAGTSVAQRWRLLSADVLIGSISMTRADKLLCSSFVCTIP